MKLIIRADDTDFRLPPQDYVDNHEKFIKLGLTETAVIQYTMDGRLHNPDPELIKYMNTAPYWDIQLHGWAHDDYSKLPKWRIDEDLKKSKARALELFGKEPTIFFPPWNCYSDDMKEVADLNGLIISNESYDIAKFIREMKAGTYTGHSLYYHLWNHHEVEQIDEMLFYAKKYEDNRP
jgi:hypothetical protein